MDKFIGKRLDGRYEISELIGTGGMAVVYKAYDRIDDRTVAVKILKDEFLANDEFRRRFKNESKAIAVLSHPNIVKVYDVSFGDVLQYIVMEYINGITLKEYIEQQGVIEWREAIHFTRQILKALQHAHEKGIVHRDIKPQNIMLLADGTIKVTDFGIARFSRSEQRTVTNKAIGSVHYISPEQARGDFTDGRADIYSVGVMLYEMTTGRVPFQADSAVSVAIMQLQNEPVKPTEINPNIPFGLEQITLKAMAKDVENRFESAGEMLRDLTTVLNDPSVSFNYRFREITPRGANDARRSKSASKSVKNQKNDDHKSSVLPVLAGIAIVFVVALIVAGIFVFNIFNSDDNQSFPCPDFVNQKYEDIKKDSRYKDYSFDVVYESSNEYETGIIFDQEPKKDTKIKAASKIKLYVSSGGKEIVLKDYANYSLDEAKADLTDLGLKYVVEEVSSDEISEGFIISTDIPAKSTVKAGQTIKLYVSTGHKKVTNTVPSLTGLDQDSAERAIKEAGFKVGSIGKDYSDSIGEGYVIYQSPAAGEKLEIDKPISFTVSKGPRPTTTTPPTTQAPETSPNTSAAATEANNTQAPDDNE